jgi:hypothetical protein
VTNIFLHERCFAGYVCLDYCRAFLRQTRTILADLRSYAHGGVDVMGP